MRQHRFLCALCKEPVKRQDQVVWAQFQGDALLSGDHVWHKHCFHTYRNKERRLNPMHRAAFGDSVEVRYGISLEDGTSVASASCDQVIEFVIGDGSALPG
jgi:hypothetical protein